MIIVRGTKLVKWEKQYYKIECYSVKEIPFQEFENIKVVPTPFFTCC